MNRANFSHYERDTAIPPCESLSKIADILNTTTDYLLGRDLADDSARSLARDIQGLDSDDQYLLRIIIKGMELRKEKK